MEDLADAEATSEAHGQRAPTADSKPAPPPAVDVMPLTP